MLKIDHADMGACPICKRNDKTHLRRFNFRDNFTDGIWWYFTCDRCSLALGPETHPSFFELSTYHSPTSKLDILAEATLTVLEKWGWL